MCYRLKDEYVVRIVSGGPKTRHSKGLLMVTDTVLLSRGTSQSVVGDLRDRDRVSPWTVISVEKPVLVGLKGTGVG